MRNPLYDQLFAPLKGSARPFLILPEGGEMAGGAFLERVHQAANALVEAGVKPGDRVAVQIAKTPESLAVYGACVALGAIFLPLNTAYTANEISYFLENATPSLVLLDPARQTSLPCKTLTLGADGLGSFTTLAAAQPTTFEATARGPDDLAAFLYTSGTTGRSKGAMLTQGNLLSNAETLVQEWRFTPQDVQLHALPIFHTHGLFVATNVALLSQSALIFLPNFDVETTLRLLPKASTMMGVPTFYTRLLADPRFDKALCAHMRLFTSGSAPLLAETHVAFFARTGHRILERYGMTETNMNTSNPYDGARRAGTVGRPLPGIEVQVCDPGSGAALPQGEIGVIEVRGPNVFKGYWQMPEKTREELRDTGFFITGDLGQFDADGYLSIVGRQKDLIISGGFNIYPKEIELILDEQPGILEAAVIGVPHPDFGEAVLAILVPKPGQRPDLAAIETDLREKLARFKQPKALVLADDLPRNTMGKVQKNELRKTHAAWFGV